MQKDINFQVYALRRNEICKETSPKNNNFFRPLPCTAKPPEAWVPNVLAQDKNKLLVLHDGRPERHC